MICKLCGWTGNQNATDTESLKQHAHAAYGRVDLFGPMDVSSFGRGLPVYDVSDPAQAGGANVPDEGEYAGLDSARDLQAESIDEVGIVIARLRKFAEGDGVMSRHDAAHMSGDLTVAMGYMRDVRRVLASNGL